MHRRHKHITALPPWQRRRNALISRRRAPVEAVFSAMKRLYGKARTRCHSLTTNRADLITFAVVYARLYKLAARPTRGVSEAAEV